MTKAIEGIVDAYVKLGDRRSLEDLRMHRRRLAIDLNGRSGPYDFNRPIVANHAADAIRKHWRIENKLHYTRDVTLGEDASRIRKNPGVFARMRSFAYNILRINQSDTIAQDRYAAALGGLKSIFSMRFSKER